MAKITLQRANLTIPQGPAHAVYFATYEAVKQAMGGNAAGHHPLAAGMFYKHLAFCEKKKLLTVTLSIKRCMCDNRQ